MLLWASFTFLFIWYIFFFEKTLAPVSFPIQSTPIPITLSSENPMRQMEADTILMDTARREKNPKRCEQILQKTTQDMCVREVSLLVAVEKGDVTLCESISDEVGKNMCREHVLAKKIEKSTNISDCESIVEPVEKNTCITRITNNKIAKNPNPRLCNELDNPMEKDDCIRNTTLKKAITSGDMAICESLEPMMQSDCKLHVIIEKATATWGSISVCDTLSDTMLIPLCKKKASIELVQKTGDITYCRDTFIPDCEVKVTVKKALIISDIRPCSELAFGLQQSCKNLYEELSKTLELR